MLRELTFAPTLVTSLRSASLLTTFAGALKINYRILMFAPAFAPDMASANLNNSKLALVMMKRGWDLQVISQPDEGFTYEVSWRDPWLSLRDHTHVLKTSQLNPLKCTFARAWNSLRMGGYPIGGVRWGAAALALGLVMHRDQPFDFVFSRYLPEYAHLPAMQFNRITGVPWLANWNDPALGCWPPPYKQERNLVDKLIRARYLRQAASKATINTFTCDRLRDRMVHFLCISDSKRRAKVIPHTFLADFEPSTYCRGPTMRLCHAGNLSAERNPKIFFHALRRLLLNRNARGQVQFEVIGVENVGLRKLVEELQLQDTVLFTGGKDFLDTLNELASCDVNVILEAPCQEGVFLPGKLVDYIPLRRPILAVSPRIGTIQDLLSEHGGGYVVDCTSEEEVYKALIKLYDAWLDGSLESIVSDELTRSFSPDTVIDLYEAILADLNSMVTVREA